MTMIKTTFIENNIELSNTYIRCIEIENKAYFYRFISSLNCICKGELLDDFSVYDIKPDNIILILDYFNISYNSKKIIGELNKLIRSKINENDYNELIKRFRRVLNIFKRVIGKIDIPISIVEDINVDGLIKLLNININFSTNLLTNLLLLIDINKELSSENILVFVNLKEYLTKEELLELYKYSIYNGQVIALIDSKSYGVTIEYEKKILIDDTLEEYVL